VDDKQKRRDLFVFGLYELSKGNPLESIETARLGKHIGMEEPEISEVGYYLKQEDLIDYYSFTHINITHRGRKYVEAKMAETYAQKERRVLEAIADMSRMSSAVVFPDLAKRLGMNEQEVAIICERLDEKSQISFPGGDFVQIKAAGYEALDLKKEPPVPTINQINIGTNYGNAAIGSYINQTINVNPEFDNAIKSLIELVVASSIEDSKKEELLDDIIQVNKLTARKSALDKIKTVFDYVKVGLQAANLIAAATPHLEKIWHHIQLINRT